MKNTTRINKITTATTTIVCLLCSFPQQGLYALLPMQNIDVDMANLSKELSGHIVHFEEMAAHILPIGTHELLKRSVVNSFKNLAQLIHKAPNSHEATTQFFQSFIDQTNIQKNADYEIQETCQIIRQNMDRLSLSTEYQEHLLLGLDIMQTKQITSGDDLSIRFTQRIYWPWNWNWFGLNKKDRKHATHLESTYSKIGVWEVIAFALFCCAVVLVAFLAPAVLSMVVPALTAGAEIFIKE